MKQYTKQANSMFYTSILYICSFFLFLEWIFPLEDVTDTENITVFIIYAAFCFIISLLRLKWWLAFSVKGIALIIVIHSLYYDISLLNLTWFGSFVAEIVWNMQMIFQQQLHELTQIFRSFLFLILIWLMSYLLYYWFVQMKRFFIFILMTFVYVTVLDTFTVYDAGFAIVRTFIVSFIALGIANYVKELDREKISSVLARKNPVWGLFLMLLIFMSVLVGFVAPKMEPQWPDPVPFIKSAAEEAGKIGTGTVRKVGYGEDDSRLGGSFIQDHTPVFRAYANEKQYWRIETKDVYTGKGWELSTDATFEPVEENNLHVETFSPEKIRTEMEEAVLQLQYTDIGKLMYPYGFQSVKHITDAEVEYELDRQSEAINTELGGKIGDTVDYQFTFQSPTFPIQELRKVYGGDEPEILERYTQLPGTLPERVKDLAAEITAAYDNRYDKAKAVERYFGNNGYIYETTDVPVPAANEDYVDQFLFDSMVGYCDNFSTAMVVLLRSVDIPARWVKGFTGGEMVEVDSETGLHVYEVTNANAHSWVEVYFPEYGWIPFEPTQGFSNLAAFANAPAADSSPEEELQESPEQRETEEEKDDAEEEAEEVFQPVTEKKDTSIFSEFRWGYLLLLAAIVGFAVLILYLTRFRWQTKLIEMRLTNNSNPQNYQDAYHFLMKVLQRNGIVKRPDQTLREFANAVDKHYETDEMRKLTHVYEQMLYNQGIGEPNSRKISELWKNLINRILG